MKNYYLFVYEFYHSDGGMKDFIGRFESLEAIKEYLIKETKKDSCRDEGKLVYGWEEMQVVKFSDEGVEMIYFDIHVHEFIESTSYEWESFIDPEDDERMAQNKWLSDKLQWWVI